MSHCMYKILFKSVQVSACYCKMFTGSHFFVDTVYTQKFVTRIMHVSWRNWRREHIVRTQ